MRSCRSRGRATCVGRSFEGTWTTHFRQTINESEQIYCNVLKIHLYNRIFTHKNISKVWAASRSRSPRKCTIFHETFDASQGREVLFSSGDSRVSVSSKDHMMIPSPSNDSVPPSMIITTLCGNSPRAWESAVCESLSQRSPTPPCTPLNCIQDHPRTGLGYPF